VSVAVTVDGKRMARKYLYLTPLRFLIKYAMNNT